MTTKYKIDGMTCGGCVKSVEKALGLLDGLDFSVKLEGGELTVEGDYDEGAIKEAVEDAGFDFAGRIA